MKASELRLGNYVKVGNKNYIVQELSNSLVRCAIRFKENRICEIKEIQPIKLHSSMLEKIKGCTKFSSRYEQSFKIGSSVLSSNSLGEVNFIFFDEGDRYEHIEFLHQLQNLHFALWGEELVFSTEP